MEALSKIIVKKVLLALMEKPASIVVFVGDLEFIAPLCADIRTELPSVFCSSIHIEPIENSTKFLKGHKYTISIYHDSCFRVISPHEFLDTHYDWLYKQITRLYDNQPGLEEWFSVEDAFQEICLQYLDKILSKYDNQCNLRSFVANRLRRYFDYVIMQQLKIREAEITCMLRKMEESK